MWALGQTPAPTITLDMCPRRFYELLLGTITVPATDGTVQWGQVSEYVSFREGRRRHYHRPPFHHFAVRPFTLPVH